MRVPSYQIAEFPKSRLATIDVGRYTRHKHIMYGFLEVDVTEARRSVRELRREGKQVSFTAWMIKAIANSVARNKLVHAIGLGRRRIVIFDDVDVGIPIEREVDGKGVPLALRIGAANRKTVEDIEAELLAALNQPIRTEHDFVLNENGVSPAMMRLFYVLPQWLRILSMRLLFGSPFKAQPNMGTVAVTAVSAIGRVSGWMMPTRTWHNLLMAFGSINRKPWVVKDQIEIREILHLTAAFDHDVVDGVPARRFLDDLVQHVERGRFD